MTNQQSLNGYVEERDTIDFEIQHTFDIGNHNITVGGGYRHYDAHFEPSYITILGLGTYLETNIHENHHEMSNLFFQDKIELNEKLTLTLGLKLEYNDNTGFEYQPSLRISWTPDERQTVWAAVSRAVRTIGF